MTQRKSAGLAFLLFATVASAGCAMGPSASGTFDRTLSVSGPIRLELNNTSGDVSITGSADGKEPQSDRRELVLTASDCATGTDRAARGTPAPCRVATRTGR